MSEEGYHLGGVNFSNGIQDDLNLISGSLVHGKPVPLGDVAITLLAALSSAYLGIQVLRALGAKSDLSWALGAVGGSLALDIAGKYWSVRRGES
tara:strand:+ start:212 stop:493 length:282 start_codon:yes stop_codon:yes gene_type:complete